jgi:small-conductance mechanosensitive channel
LNVLDWQYYHNTLREWVVAAAILIGVFATLAVVRRLIVRRLRYDAARRRDGGRVDSLAADLAHRTGALFFVALGVYTASLDLTLPPPVETVLRAFTIMAVLLQVGLWGDGLVMFGLQRYVARRSTPSGDDDDGVAASRTTVAALGVLVRAVLWILVILVALDSLGVRVTALITGLGVTGIAIALAVQNILGDLFAALSIVIDKPFVVGDAIAVDTVSGVVEHIGLKTTRVRAQTGEQVVVSNADLLKSRIRNFRRLRERTSTFVITLDPASPTDAVSRIPGLLRELIQTHSGVRFGRSHVTPPTLNGIGIETVYTVLSPDYGQFMDVQQAISVGLLTRLADAGLKLATSGGVSIVWQRGGEDGGRTDRGSTDGGEKDGVAKTRQS